MFSLRSLAGPLQVAPFSTINAISATFSPSVVVQAPCAAADAEPAWHRMHEIKDTLRALVRIGYDGRVHKTFRGPQAGERFATEVRVLRYLEARGCNFVPKLLEADPAALRIVTTSCGSRVERLDDARAQEIFAELLPYGVRHDDAEVRNITYRQRDGRFCVIDFEFATVLDDPAHAPA